MGEEGSRVRRGAERGEGEGVAEREGDRRGLAPVRGATEDEAADPPRRGDADRDGLDRAPAEGVEGAEEDDAQGRLGDGGEGEGEEIAPAEEGSEGAVVEGERAAGEGEGEARREGGRESPRSGRPRDKIDDEPAGAEDEDRDPRGPEGEASAPREGLRLPLLVPRLASCRDGPCPDRS